MTARRDPEATRAAILDAAEEVFVAKGVADGSTAEIARRAGVTKSLIHHHFGSKEGLWAEVKQRRFAEYAEGQLEALETAPADADLLRRSMQLYFRFLERNPQMARMFAWMFLENDEECSDLDRRLTAAGIEKIAEAQARGELRRDVDPGFVLFGFLALCQYWFQLGPHFCGHAGFDAPKAELDEPYLEAALKIFFEGVAPR